MQEAQDILKLARSVVAGVSVGLDLPDAREVGSLAYQMNYDIGKKFKTGGPWGDVVAEADGGDYFKFEGTINVYVLVDDAENLKASVEKIVKAWQSKLKGEGFRFGSSRWNLSNSWKRKNGEPALVLRVQVTKNPDEEIAEMQSSQMTYGTWGSILARLQRLGGLSDKHDAMSGEMPIKEFIKAVRDVTLIGDKESRFIDQIIRMIKVGLKRGAKEIRWG
jgi:hypothetical protein